MRRYKVLGMLSEIHTEKLRVTYNVVTKAWLDWPRDCNGDVKRGPSDRTALQVALRNEALRLHGRRRRYPPPLSSTQRHCECQYR
jgi:hypothetical protein